MKVVASCPGSCGELIQGWLDDSQKLVSYGINRFSMVEVSLKETSKSGHLKAEEALRRTLTCFDLPSEVSSRLSLTINSDLPVAKGMASSTADIAATCQAVAAFFGKQISRDQIIEICLAIERTDSILFPTLTLFEQRTGSIREQSGWAPLFYVLVLEPDETLTTEAFHSTETDRLFYQQRKQFLEVHQHYQHAVKIQSLKFLGEAATQSAVLNQNILPKPYFSELLKFQQYFKWLGINVAHSGSVVGIMLETVEEIKEAIRVIQRSKLSEWYSRISVHHSFYGGVQLLEVGRNNEKINGCRSIQRVGENDDSTWLDEPLAKAGVQNSAL